MGGGWARRRRGCSGAVDGRPSRTARQGALGGGAGAGARGLGDDVGGSDGDDEAQAMVGAAQRQHRR